MSSTAIISDVLKFTLPSCAANVVLEDTAVPNTVVGLNSIVVVAAVISIAPPLLADAIVVCTKNCPPAVLLGMYVVLAAVSPEGKLMVAVAAVGVPVVNFPLIQRFFPTLHQTNSILVTVPIPANVGVYTAGEVTVEALNNGIVSSIL